MYQQRFYRQSFHNELSWYKVCVDETDLMIGSDKDLSDMIRKYVIELRQEIEDAVKMNQNIRTSLVPVEYEGASEVVRLMADSVKAAGVGPFAAVAGAINDLIAKKVEGLTEQIFIENGGDLYIHSQKDRKIGIHAGKSVLSDKFALDISADMFPLGICTSSGTVGHAFSMGSADAAVVISKSSAVADAFATAFCNRIKRKQDIEQSLEWVMSQNGIIGAVAIMGDTIGAAGNIQLVKWN